MDYKRNLSEQLTCSVEKQLKLLGEFELDVVIVGGVAATIHGSAYLTTDIDTCYLRSPDNFKNLAIALQSVNAKLRNASEDLPFTLDAETLRRGLNFTFTTDIGSFELLGEVRGVGYYEDVLPDSLLVEPFGFAFPVIDIAKLIVAKRTAGRPKDLGVVAELEAIYE